MPGNVGDERVHASRLHQAHDWTERSARYRVLSERLRNLRDDQLESLLEGTTGSVVGVGGTTGKLVVEGVPVFVKKVPLTDLELRAEHADSTANLFQLPMFYHYGIGSAGFGARREVDVHVMTTRWVLDELFHGFPILYHHRVLPQVPQPIDEPELDRWVTYWEGSPSVRARLEAIGRASAAVVLFMEHIPYTVDSWLSAQTAEGGQVAESAYRLVDRSLRRGVEFMGSRGLLHFDAHFHNLLTDGHRVYFADFGLAIHSGFDLHADESAFLRRHGSYDRCYTVTHLAQWLISNLLRIPWSDCPDYIREYARSDRPIDLPESAARIIARSAPVAAIMMDFYGKLQKLSKRTPYPADDLSRTLHR
ncbi:MAG TPA: serine/threonine protein phosphatase [Pilimelia sp.]|nr:serine/threonine protein phosphatase [Pilimelia sp.]